METEYSRSRKDRATSRETGVVIMSAVSAKFLSPEALVPPPEALALAPFRLCLPPMRACEGAEAGGGDLAILSDFLRLPDLPQIEIET